MNNAKEDCNKDGEMADEEAANKKSKSPAFTKATKKSGSVKKSTQDVFAQLDTTSFKILNNRPHSTTPQ